MGSEIPEWAMTEAQAFHDRWETGMSGAAFQEFARALVAAERRGIERAAIAADATEDVVLAVEAIRQLVGTP
jgi:hypothetical protein